MGTTQFLCAQEMCAEKRSSMKNSRKKKIFAAVLAAAMVAGLTACGGGTGESGASASGSKENEAAAAETKQYVYRCQDISTDAIPAGASIRSVMYQNDKIYALYDCWGDTAEYLALLSANIDGTDVNVTNIPMPESTDTENAYLNNAAVSKDGNAYLALGISTLVDAENYVYDQKQELQCWSPAGEMLWSQELGADLEADYVNVVAINATDNGVEVLLNGGDTAYRFIELDAAGNLVKQQNLDESKLQNLNTVVPQGDGTWLFLTYNNDYTALTGLIYDPAAGTFGSQVELPANIQNYELNAGVNGSFLLADQYGVSSWKEGDTDIKRLMNMIDSDLAASSMSYPVQISDEQFAAAYYELEGSGFRLGIFTKVRPEDIPDKKTLVFGGTYIGSDIKSKIIDFNKANTEYKITVRDYSEYATMEDYSAGTTQLNNDILAGKMPDILLVNSDIPLGNLAKKGLLADIDELIAQDAELSGKTYLDNVFEAYRIDGKLYQVIPSFTVETFIGKKSVLGDISGWNMEEFTKTLTSLGEGTSAFGETTRDAFMQYAIQYCGNDYIDSNTGKSNFDSEEFVNLIKYAATLPEQIDYDEGYDWTAYANQYRTGQTMLMPLYLYDFSRLSACINGSFGENVVYVGFPSADRDGSAVICGDSYAISAKSAYKDVAWEFVRYYLTDEYQTSDTIGGMPVNRDAFLKMAQRAMEKPYYIDEQGQKVEYDDIYYLNDEQIVLPQLTQEQMDQAVAFVEGIRRTTYRNDSVVQIINEELPAFFDGQKSAEDVAKLIQNRVQLYLDENE